MYESAFFGKISFPILTYNSFNSSVLMRNRPAPTAIMPPVDVPTMRSKQSPTHQLFVALRIRSSMTSVPMPRIPPPSMLKIRTGALSSRCFEYAAFRRGKPWSPSAETSRIASVHLDTPSKLALLQESRWEFSSISGADTFSPSVLSAANSDSRLCVSMSSPFSPLSSLTESLCVNVTLRISAAANPSPVDEDGVSGDLTSSRGKSVCASVGLNRPRKRPAMGGVSQLRMDGGRSAHAS